MHPIKSAEDTVYEGVTHSPASVARKFTERDQAVAENIIEGLKRDHGFSDYLAGRVVRDAGLRYVRPTPRTTDDRLTRIEKHLGI